MDEQASRIADPVLIASDSLSLLLLLDMMADTQVPGTCRHTQVPACSRHDYKCTIPSTGQPLQQSKHESVEQVPATVCGAVPATVLSACPQEQSQQQSQ